MVMIMVMVMAGVIIGVLVRVASTHPPPGHFCRALDTTKNGGRPGRCVCTRPSPFSHYSQNYSYVLHVLTTVSILVVHTRPCAARHVRHQPQCLAGKTCVTRVAASGSTRSAAHCVVVAFLFLFFVLRIFGGSNRQGRRVVEILEILEIAKILDILETLEKRLETLEQPSTFLISSKISKFSKPATTRRTPKVFGLRLVVSAGLSPVIPGRKSQ